MFAEIALCITVFCQPIPTTAPTDELMDDPLIAALRYADHLDSYVTHIEVAEAEAAAAQAAAEARARAIAAARASRQEERTAPVPAPVPAPAPVAPSSGDPTAAQWAALRACESGGDYTIVSSNGLWYGAYQFTLDTWASYGSSGNPAEASPAEQDRRALLLYRSRGWSPWPNCGQ